MPWTLYTLSVTSLSSDVLICSSLRSCKQNMVSWWKKCRKLCGVWHYENACCILSSFFLLFLFRAFHSMHVWCIWMFRVYLRSFFIFKFHNCLHKPIYHLPIMLQSLNQTVICVNKSNLILTIVFNNVLSLTIVYQCLH